MLIGLQILVFMDMALNATKQRFLLNEQARAWNENDEDIKMQVNCSYDADDDSMETTPFAIMVSFKMKDAFRS